MGVEVVVTEEDLEVEEVMEVEDEGLEVEEEW